MTVSDRAVIVTGASRGLGEVIARHLAADDWAVGVGYRSDTEGAERVVADIRAVGGTAQAYRGDLTDEAVVAEIVAAVGSDLGPVMAYEADDIR